MKSRNIFVALPAVFLAMSAIAAGTHGGGHGHDDEAIGKPGLATKVSRTIKVDMLDTMRFTPSSFAVKQGETIRFVVRNLGQLPHEMVLGKEKDLKAHYEVMKKNPEMEHDDPNSVSLQPGKTGEMIWQFTQSGKVDFACLHPGHFDAGMKGQVRVAGGKALAGAAQADY